MRRLKDYGLPLSILIGIVGYRPLSTLSPAIPYMLMLMLFLAFSSSPLEICAYDPFTSSYSSYRSC